jgi:hypothetical protein
MFNWLTNKKKLQEAENSIRELQLQLDYHKLHYDRASAREKELITACKERDDTIEVLRKENNNLAVALRAIRDVNIDLDTKLLALQSQA